MSPHILLRRTPQVYSSHIDAFRRGGAKKSEQKEEAGLYTTFSDYGVRACRVTPANERKSNVQKRKENNPGIPYQSHSRI
jgi:hypothetical protein